MALITTYKAWTFLIIKNVTVNENVTKHATRAAIIEISRMWPSYCLNQSKQCKVVAITIKTWIVDVTQIIFRLCTNAAQRVINVIGGITKWVAENNNNAPQ